MAFEDDIQRHVEQLKSRLPHVHGEEATKQALVVPFLQVLGYDVYDPREVQPEYIADFAEKKTRGQLEKIDYAVRVSGEPAIFVECKAADVELENHEAQLARYFNATPTVRVAVLTNGLRYKVFTDLQQQNLMDEKPWMDFDLRTIKPAEIDALKRFRKTDFAADQVVSLAERMTYYNVLVNFVSAQLRDPSEAFVRFVAGEIPTIGRVTAKVVERISPILREAIQAAIVDHVAKSFNREPEPAPPPQNTPVVDAQSQDSRDGIVTTAEELEGWALITKIVKEVYPDAVVAYRDSKSYFTVIQKNIRKWFVRLGVEKPPFWVAFRHVKLEDVKKLCPHADAADGGQHGDSKVMIRSVVDLGKLKPLILASYAAEAARLSVDEPTGEADTTTH